MAAMAARPRRRRPRPSSTPPLTPTSVTRRARPAQHADYGASDAYPQHPDAYPQQAYGTAPRAAYQGRAPLAGYPPEAEYPTNGHSGAEEQDFYDDVPPRRRMGILAIAAVFALAVIGTAGAFGYRALFGSSGASGAAAGDQSRRNADQDRARREF